MNIFVYFCFKLGVRFKNKYSFNAAMSTVSALPTDLTESGTLEHQLKWEPVQNADKIKVKDTIEAAFGETLAHNYFPEMSHQGAVVCYEEGYRVVGVVIPDLYHIVTLARHPLYRGQHLGEKILMEILAKLGKFNLRSKPDRKIANKLYQRVADDSLPIVAVDGIGYNVYWKNHSPFEVAVALAYASSQPSHFKK